MSAEDSETLPISRGGASLVDVARQAILRDILNRRFAGGEILQESRLALTLGLSRTPVREALGRLEGEGVLVRNGRLLMVRSIQLREYLDLLLVLRCLEAEAATLAAANASEAKLRGFRETLESWADPAMPAVEAQRALDDDLHATIAEASRNRELALLIADLRRKARLFDSVAAASRAEQSRREHLSLVDALLRRDGEAARDAMRLHLENARLGVLDHMREPR